MAMEEFTDDEPTTSDDPMDPITTIDRYEPDYSRQCEICGSSPVVSGTRDGKTVYTATMCGPCLWSEPRAADPATWNEASPSGDAA